MFQDSYLSEAAKAGLLLSTLFTMLLFMGVSIGWEVHDTRTGGSGSWVGWSRWLCGGTRSGSGAGNAESDSESGGGLGGGLDSMVATQSPVFGTFESGLQAGVATYGYGTESRMWSAGSSSDGGRAGYGSYGGGGGGGGGSGESGSASGRSSMVMVSQWQSVDRPKSRVLPQNERNILAAHHDDLAVQAEAVEREFLSVVGAVSQVRESAAFATGYRTGVDFDSEGGSVGGRGHDDGSGGSMVVSAVADGCVGVSGVDSESETTESGDSGRQEAGQEAALPPPLPARPPRRV